MERTLSMPIKKQWFDLILSKQKLEEYREIKPYWTSRLNKNISYLKLINGYGNKKPYLIIELKNMKVGTGKKEWGALEGELYYILELGEIKKTFKGER